MKRNEDNLEDLWDNHMHTNIHITRVPEGEEREKGTKQRQILKEKLIFMRKLKMTVWTQL